MALGIPMSRQSGGAWANTGSPNYMRNQMAMGRQDVEWAQKMDMFYSQLEQSEKALAFEERKFGEQLGEQRRQYDIGFGENQRQYDVGMEERRREGDRGFGEQQRQYNVGMGQRQTEYDQALAEQQRQYDVGQQNWLKQYQLSLNQWEEYEQTSDLNQLLLQLRIGREKEADRLRRENLT